METTSKPVYWRCHTVNLLNELTSNNRLGPAIPAISIMGKLLFVLADRARELNDPELNSLCCRLTLFSQADPESPDYDRRAVDLIHEFDAQLLKRLSK